MATIRDLLFNYLLTGSILVIWSCSPRLAPKTNPVPMPVTSAQHLTDSDKDGILDQNDKCPQLHGAASASGCPDADGDGTGDVEDSCINLAGLLKYNGCPDSDKDGMPDPTDRCPLIAGPAQTWGCPDTDADGFTDNEDSCLLQPGSRQGCPALTLAEMQLLKELNAGLFFEKGKARLIKEQGRKLDVLLRVMQRSQVYKMKIYLRPDELTANRSQLQKQRRLYLKKTARIAGIDERQLELDWSGELRHPDYVNIEMAD